MCSGEVLNNHWLVTCEVRSSHRGHTVRVSVKNNGAWGCTIGEFVRLVGPTTLWYNDYGTYVGTFGTYEAAIKCKERIESIFVGKNLLEEEMQKMQKKTKRAVFHLKKVIEKCRPMYDVLGWENVLCHDNLPSDYLKEINSFFSDEYYTRIFYRESREYGYYTELLQNKKQYSIEYINKVRDILTKGSESLAAINRKIQAESKESKSWVGTEDIVI